MLSFTILRSKRKTLVLRVLDSHNVEVRAPEHLPDSKIHEFVESHRDWILKKQTEIATKLSNRKYFTDSGLFYVLGRAYPLIIKPLSHPPLWFDGSSFTLSKTHQAKTKDLFMAWYKKQAGGLIKAKTESLAKQHNFKFKSIKIGNAKSRWGSCSGKNNLSFSLRLIMAPIPVVDYVIVHELVHTVHHNHSKSFWNQVSKYCPNYKVERSWLKLHGHDLVI